MVREAEEFIFWFINPKNRSIDGFDKEEVFFAGVKDNARL